MIIVAGWLRVDPARRAEYLMGCRAVVDAARQAHGCVDFALSADLVDPERIHVYEQWESDDDLERFRGSGPEPAQAGEILEARVMRYRISSAEPA